jgi:hypothetical protein
MGFYGMSAGPGDFDLHAAWLRRAKGDMKAFVEALAARLESALPESVEVERRRDGLFSKTSHVAKIVIHFETSLLTLELDRGRLHAKRAKVVRGVTISSDVVTVPAWLEEVVHHTRASGEDANATHGVLHDFLLS